MSSLSKKNIAILQMLACAALWSIAGILIKLIPYHPVVIAGFRSLVSALCVLVFMLFTKQKIHFSRSVCISGVLLCLTFLCFVGANKLTNSATAIVLQFTSPVFIMIFSALFKKQRFAKADIITVFLTLLGISLFFFDQLGAGTLLGNIVAILSGAFMGGMFLAVGESDDEEKMSGILLGHILTACVGLVSLFFFKTEFIPSAAVCLFVLGVFQLGIPYILFALAVRHCPPLACSLLSALEPLLNPVWVFIFAGELPGPLSIIGGLFVIAVITVWCIYKDKKEIKEN